MLALPGFAGVMALLACARRSGSSAQGVDDVLLGYPSVDTGALDALAADPVAAAAVTLMVDDVAQVELARRAPPDAHGTTLRRVPRRRRVPQARGSGRWSAHLGVRRSPVHSAARRGRARRRDRPPRRASTCVGVMFYEAQVAGLPDSSPAVRAVKRLSIRDLAVRRAAVVDAVQSAVGHELTLVNSGGSGSVETSAADPVVTEVTAGSGLFVPTLFDAYRSFTPRPAAFFGLDVVRVPGPGYATVFGGGYIASGPATAVPPAAARVARRAGADRPRGRRRGADAAAAVRRRGPARRRPGLVPARQGRRGHGALRRRCTWSAATTIETTVPTYRGEQPHVRLTRTSGSGRRDAPPRTSGRSGESAASGRQSARSRTSG